MDKAVTVPRRWHRLPVKDVAEALCRSQARARSARSQGGPQDRRALRAQPVVLFDRSVTLSVPLTAVTAESRPELLKALQKLNYSGRHSDITVALEQAVREFEANVREGAEKSIVLLTHGLLDPPNTALVQARLSALGYNVGPIDGIIRPKTRDAIREFQMQVGMPADGRLNKALLSRLEEAYWARWQGELAAKATRAGIKVITVTVLPGF